MKTTIELPDELFIALKKQAAQERKPMKAIVERALRRFLKEAPREAGRKLSLPAIRGGKLPEGLDISSREKMYAWLDAHEKRR